MNDNDIKITFQVDQIGILATAFKEHRQNFSDNTNPFAHDMHNSDMKAAIKAIAELQKGKISDEIRNRINRIISGCMTRGMSSEATTDEVVEYLRFCL